MNSIQTYSSKKNMIMFSKVQKPIIAMLYLPAGIDHQNHLGLNESFCAILSDLEKIHQAGFDGICLENEKDSPYKVEAEAHDISFYTLLTRKIVENSDLPIGFNYLLNDPKTSLAIAKVCEASFVRSDYFVDQMIRESDERVMDVYPNDVRTYRKKIKADNIKFYADVQVKHAKLIKQRPLLESVNESIEFGADGVIVSGSWTGKAPDLSDLMMLKEKNLSVPVIVGSGFNTENASTILPLCDEVIVGTAILDKDGHVNLERAKALMNRVNELRS
ncbi:MAG: BtpA/SgcQ family protein [Deltaproteobacteria bacterium]|nr:MAG: BtpA/SgcQ family protein [Deltaproteobacteria bacterium]